MMRGLLKKCISGLLAVTMSAMMIGAMPVMAEESRNSEELFLPVNDIEEPVIVEMDPANDPKELHTVEYTGTASAEEIQYWKQFSNKSIYNQLSDEEKRWWDEIEESCIQIMTGTDDVDYTVYAQIGDTSYTEIRKLLDIFKYSNPQYYFLNGASYYPGQSMAFSLYSYCYDGEERAKMTAALKNSIDSYLSKIDTSKKDEEIERDIYTMLIRDITYVSNADYDQNVYSALVLKETVCAGYSMAMTLLANGAGLDAVGIVGYADNGNGVGAHGWNMVNIHGFWFLTDVTWGDQIEYICYLWYNQSAELFRTDHIEEDYCTAQADKAIYDGCMSIWDEPVTYFDAGNYQYYIVNRNTERGDLLVKPVETYNGANLSGAPEYVTYDNQNYKVLGGVEDGWHEEDGALYWYENGVRQGYDPDDPSYRGKEIYDPGTKAWYWLDNAQKGAVAKSKDVYQESDAGRYADREDGTGKWVRYDENGHMVKGWDNKDGNTYYFDLTYGTMAKGYTTVDGVEYYFSATTGALESIIGEVPEYGWKNIDGADYWYENYERQGCSPRSSYRGKEIYDRGTDAWYWLDNVDGGKKATSKDVYQESDAGQWADREDGTGKWVRYDENGHMIKGWSTTSAGTYYFDPIYGTMAKGSAVIDGNTYYFDPDTGVLQ